MKRQQAAQAELLGNLVKAHAHWAENREETFRENLETYDPYPGDQPCADWEMDDYGDYEDDFAFDAQNTFEDFAEKARKLLEMETV
ncbi:hypothetical protein [Streptomyces sp. NPDC048489]|uniref:hypothetical protein n=1 Tax=Streptomyces sp. NPDC048489 TaxID=3154504 RepID=UPI00343B1344